jgi:acyl-CoA thioesterase FadM
MPFFSMQYRILFHDTMAYGSHHHMVNIKLQNIARETMTFDSRTGGIGWEEQLKDKVMLTREAHSLNLAPVGLGQSVATLLSYEEPSRSTVRLCFRMIGQQGQPVSCGYQTMLLLHKDTHEPAPASALPIFRHFLDAENAGNLMEKLTNPSFAERVHCGSRWIREIFSEPVRQLGKAVANAPREKAYPKIIDEAFNEYPF